jgi:hypothetical protein
VLKRVSAAFPALQAVKLSHMSLSHADLSSLTACSQLTHLDLQSCELQETGPKRTMSPLSALHSLKQLSLEDTDSSIASGLTQLTGLSDLYGDETLDECLKHITCLTQLQHLELDKDTYNITSEQVASIVTSLRQLTSLGLYYILRQPAFDALLTHAAQLTRLTCSYLHLDEDRSASPCSWKELVVRHCDLDAETLACIPTASLTRLAFGSMAVFPSPSPTLEFETLQLNMPELVQRGLVNLMRCPAWHQCGSGVHIRVVEHPAANSPELLGRVLGMLAPLVGKEVLLSIDMPEADVGAPELQQLGGALGSSLNQLGLERCEVSDGFWPAVWAYLPGLQQLTVGDKVQGAVGAHEVAFFCSRATRPLQLSLGQRLHKEAGAEGKLERQCRVWGVLQVTVNEAVDI